MGSSSWLGSNWDFRLLSLAKSGRVSSVDASSCHSCSDLHWIVDVARTSDEEISEFISLQTRRFIRRKIMYAFIVRKMVKQSFEFLNQGNYESVLEGISPSITHTFSGTHALGGTRHSIEAMRQWFQRLYILSPELNFTIKNIAVSGFPWDTTIAVEWVDSAKPADGSAYVNEGVHIIKMRWGKVVYLHAYLDTQLTEALCNRLSAYGIGEASAPPIED
jgi:ketosteroid isomerase-like protein